MPFFALFAALRETDLSSYEYLIYNKDKIVEMGRNARRFVEEEFNPEKYYQKLMEVYALGRKRG